MGAAVVTFFSSNDTINHVGSLTERGNLLFHGRSARGSSVSATAEHGLLLIVVVLDPSRNESTVGSLQSRTLAAFFRRLAECASDSTSRLGAETSDATVDVGNGNTDEKSQSNSGDAKDCNDGVGRRRWGWVTLVALSVETVLWAVIGTMLRLAVVRLVRLISMVRRRGRVAVMGITRARRALWRRRMASREGERKMTMVGRRRRGRSMVRRTVVRGTMVRRVSAVSMMRAVRRAMVRWGRRRSENVVVESMSGMSHLISHGVQNTLNTITILDLLVSGRRRGRILLAKLLSNRRLSLLNKLLKLKNLLVKSFQFHQLNLKLLLRVLELAVGVLPDRRRVIGGGLVACRGIVLLAEGHGETPYVVSVSNIGNSDRCGLLEGHPEGRLLIDGHVVKGLYIEAH